MNGVEPLISVVIPTYNYAHLLPRALDSVISQWADNVELIVVNDGSQDGTENILLDYGRRHPQLQVINQKNAGAAAARNRGIRIARGRYTLLLDADDELLPGALSVLCKEIERNPDVGMVLGAQTSMFADGRERSRLPTPVSGTSEQRTRRYLLEKRISISHCSSLFRRDLLLKRPYPEHLSNGEDIPVFAYLLVAAPVATTDVPLARIHKHADSRRHQRQDGASYVDAMVQDVFAYLPENCQKLRKRYAAQRYLSLFRAAILAGDTQQARRFYCRALRLSVKQSLRWSYIRKLFRLLTKA